MKDTKGSWDTCQIRCSSYLLTAPIFFCIFEFGLCQVDKHGASIKPTTSWGLLTEKLIEMNLYVQYLAQMGKCCSLYGSSFLLELKASRHVESQNWCFFDVFLTFAGSSGEFSGVGVWCFFTLPGSDFDQKIVSHLRKAWMNGSIIWGGGGVMPRGVMPAMVMRSAWFFENRISVPKIHLEFSTGCEDVTSMEENNKYLHYSRIPSLLLYLRWIHPKYKYHIVIRQILEACLMKPFFQGSELTNTCSAERCRTTMCFVACSPNNILIYPETKWWV